mmetsp:Transcript_45258/g.133989  ORF Transcript_45258/g.133989 Transcript_45258/m.133989 type:complete len:311 (-) Transcript_45258:346-1278(-)
MLPCSSQTTPLVTPAASSDRKTASRFLSRQRGGSCTGNSPWRTAWTFTSRTFLSPRGSTLTRWTSSPASKGWSWNVAATPKGSADFSLRRSTTRLCSGCTNQTEAPTDLPPSITSMSPSGCGTVPRSVTMRPSSALTTTPTPCRRRMSASSSSAPATTRSVSKLCTVRKSTVQRLLSRGTRGPAFFAFLAFLLGGSFASSNGASASPAPAASGSPAAAATCRGVQRRVRWSRVQARCGHQWRCIFTKTSFLRRALAPLGMIHETLKYSLSRICFSASSNAARLWHWAPFTASTTASDFTASPKTKPAWAT